MPEVASEVDDTVKWADVQPDGTQETTVEIETVAPVVVSEEPPF